MKIKDILAKVAKGETLTAEETAFLVAYDPQKEIDSAAAAARKKAESDAAKAAEDLAAAQQQLKDAQAKLDEAGSKGKTDLQKLQEQIITLQKQVESATTEKQKLIRQQKLDDVVRRSGLQFVKEVDGNIMRRALDAEFAPLADGDLDLDEKVKPVIDTFRARNKAVILDTTGHGTGHPPHAPTDAADRAKKIEEMTPAERKADLKKSGIL